MTDAEFDQIWQLLICSQEALNTDPADREPHQNLNFMLFAVLLNVTFTSVTTCTCKIRINNAWSQWGLQVFISVIEKKLSLN